MRFVFKLFIIFLSLALTVLLLVLVFSRFYTPHTDQKFGVSFSAPLSRYLGIDPKATLEAGLKDLGFKKIRLSAYWSDVERERDKFDFSDIYWQLDLAEKYNAEVIMSVGEKLPRWPECHVPDWAKSLPYEEREQRILRLVEESVKKLKKYDSIKIWQVENEAIFGFGGECPKKTRSFLMKEIQLVKSLDDRPTMVTDSGEMGRWIPSATSGADMFGSTLYFQIYNKYLGYFNYPQLPILWHFKGGVLKVFTGVTDVYGVELQAEPWVIKGFIEVPVEQQIELMNPQILTHYIDLAKQIGFKDYYLWGLEWWYWMKEKHNYPDMWEAIKFLPK